MGTVAFRVPSSFGEGKEIVLFEFDDAGDNTPRNVSVADLVPKELMPAISPALSAAKYILDQLKQLEPEKAEIEFGLELTAGVHFFKITNTEAKANIKVTLTWEKSSGAAAAAAP